MTQHPCDDTLPHLPFQTSGLEGVSAWELAEALDDGVITVNALGQVQAVNPGAERLLQRPRAELLGRTLQSLFDEPALLRALARGEPAKLVAHRASSGRSLEVRLHPRRGQGWLFVRDVSLEYARGSPRGDPSSFEEAQRRLRLVLDHTPVLLFAFDTQGILTVSEGKGVEGLGKAQGELVGESIFKVYADIDWIIQSVHRVLAGEEVSAVGNVHGTWFEVHYTPLRDARGSLSGGIGIAFDVTARERAIQVLRHQQSVLQYVIANVPHAVFWKDRKGRFLGGNQNFINDTGMGTLEHLVGKSDYDVWKKREEADFFVQVDREVMEQGRAFHDIEEPVLRSDGTQRTLLTSKVPIRNQDGHVTGLLGIYVDITARKRMETELQKAKQVAEEAARAKDEFLTVMSHELRTPLTLILGPLGTLLASSTSTLPDRTRYALERIHGNAVRLFHLVDDILDHQKLGAGQLSVAPQPVDVCALVAGIVEDARPAGGSRRIDVRFEPDASLGTLLLDGRKFEKLVLNLLGNALKFTPAEGRVTVRLRRVEGELELSVSDTGPGIPKDRQEVIFQRFQQLDGSATRQHGGTGMGLAIVKEFTELMGGHVRVESEPGKGACFTVRLPAEPARPTHAGPEERPPSASHQAYFQQFQTTPRAQAEPRRPARDAPHLLIAEDNPGMRAYLAELLADSYDLELVENGQQAWDAVQRRRPDVIVSDVMMPEVDGMELAARLKADPRFRDVPLLLLTAKTGRDDVVYGLDSGADDYLGKPFSPAELKARVRAAERLHRVYMELDARTRELQATLHTLRDTQAEVVEGARQAAVGTLVAGLCHELNNPLAAIRMNAQLLARHAVDPRLLHRALLVIERQSQRCACLLTALQGFSGQAPVKRAWYPAGALVERALATASPEAHRRTVRLVPGLPAAALPWVHVNATEVETALLNVVTNALEASPAGATVRVEARPLSRGGQQGLEVRVLDSGPGIPPAVLPQVLDLFFTTKAPGEGMGLGLPLAQQFITGQGGTLDVESEEGHGATVRLWLPARDAPPDVPGVAAEAGRAEG